MPAFSIPRVVHLHVSDPVQPMYQCDSSKPSVGLANDVPSSKDSCSFHQAHILPVQLWLLFHLLEWVSCVIHLGVSSVCCAKQHLLKQYL